MLKITKSSEAISVTTLVVVIYSPPGIGKTSMGFTAEKPLTIDFDKGSHRAKNRRDVVQVEKWADVTEISADDLKNYKTIVVDTAGRALDVLAMDIIARDPKMGRGGALSLQGYGELKSKFTAWVKLVRSFGLDVVLLAHSDESRKGDEVLERLDVQGGSKNEIYKSADVMGRIYLTNGRRTLNLSPTDTAFGKNPGQLPALEVPDYSVEPLFLAGVIEQTKVALNAMTDEQIKTATALAEWKDKVEALTVVADFDALVAQVRTADENIRRVFLGAAKAKGFTFDKAAGVFKGPAVEAKSEAVRPVGTTTVVASGAEGAKVAAKLEAEQNPAEREAGDDSADEEAANRAAAAPTAAEIAKMDAKTAAKKGKAA